MGRISSPTHTSLPVTRSTRPRPDQIPLVDADELRPQLGSHLVQLPVKNIGTPGVTQVTYFRSDRVRWRPALMEDFSRVAEEELLLHKAKGGQRQ